MSAKDRTPGRRLSKEQEQENRSRHQLCDHLAELGWLTSRVETDMGEDLLVQIFNSGETTGLSFYMQLKSSANTEKLKRKKSPTLGYRLEVKDIEHWEKQTTLVVLVVWDVKKREGWWRSIPEIIQDLDEAAEGWRKKKTATVTVPLVNCTDRAGTARLRRCIADHNVVLASSSTEENIGFVFETTEAGLAAFRQLVRAIDFDEPLTLEGKHAPKIRFPEWHRRLYGHAPLVELTRLEKGRATPAKQNLILRVEVDSPEGHAEYPYVEMRFVAQGRKRMVLTNEHQALPLVFRIEMTDDIDTIGFWRERFGRTVYEARDATVFLLAATAPGAVVRISHLPTGNEIGSIPFSRTSPPYDVQALRSLRETLDKLCYVQQRVAHVGAFRMPDDGVLSPDEIKAIDSLFGICRSGQTDTTMALSFEIPPGFKEPPVPTIRHRERAARLLGVRIPLGDVWVKVLDLPRFIDAVRSAVDKANTTKRSALVELEDLRVRLEYLDWLPGNLPWAAMYEALDRLAENTGRYDGYFTRAHARAAGASDTIFDALLAEHKIEPVDSGVYRLVHFPRSDHENLISLWLQTDREGVISHETALLLHELSDILPARRNITVPPGWALGGRELPTDVVVHHAEVREDELFWHGIVPYTAPLRTVLDCIAVGVSPDLIEQAIAEGLYRGLFAAEDLPPSVRAGAA
jgi:hypothetical protein